MEKYVILFAARNKDNKNLKGFKERRKHFLGKTFALSPYWDEFVKFVNEGVPGEFCRLYISTNSRNMEKVKKALICELIQNDDFNLEKINGEIISIAMKKENAATKHWAFDFDIDDEDEMQNFVDSIVACDATVSPIVYKTPHGYAIWVEHGFDTRDLLARYTPEQVSLHRDNLICIAWTTKGE